MAMHSDRPGLLAVFAHPDDEMLLAGGTLAKYAAEGFEVFLLCATRGELGQKGEYKNLNPREFGLLRQPELESACRALGIHKPLFLDCADQHPAKDCWNSATQEIVQSIRSIRPEVVITFGPDGISGHPDPVALSQITIVAFWAAGAASSSADGRRGQPATFKPSRLYHVLRSGALPPCCQLKEHINSPTLTTAIDIKNVGSRKLQAVRYYRSQKHLQPLDQDAVKAILNQRLFGHSKSSVTRS